MIIMKMTAKNVQLNHFSNRFFTIKIKDIQNDLVAIITRVRLAMLKCDFCIPLMYLIWGSGSLSEPPDAKCLGEYSILVTVHTHLEHDSWQIVFAQSSHETSMIGVSLKISEIDLWSEKKIDGI